MTPANLAAMGAVCNVGFRRCVERERVHGRRYFLSMMMIPWPSSWICHQFQSKYHHDLPRFRTSQAVVGF
jgi:hypothetical protein